MNRNKTKKEIRALAKEASYKKASFAGITSACLLAAGSLVANVLSLHPDDSSAVVCSTNPCNMTFQVNVQDALSVSITTPETGATGNVGDFLRNTVNLSINSNVTNGFTASMYSSADNTSSTKTDLAHTTLGSSYVIPALSSGTQRSSNNFTDHWGYSLKNVPTGSSTTYGETDAGNNDSYYYPLTANTSSPITILAGAAGTKSGTQSIYFGAKASTAKPSGTYSNTVVISVVTGTINPNNNPITPSNPATPTTDPVANDGQSTYTGTGTTGVGISSSDNIGTTVATTTSTSGSGSSATNTTTTQISTGDNTQATPQGVTTASEANTASNPLPIALAAAAGVTATAGIAAFALAKRDNDDDES